MKTVKAVRPYIHPGHLNFKLAPYEAWVEKGGETMPSHFPPRLLHGLAYRYELPSLWQNKRDAVLMFVEPLSITFDTFPYYATHEIIPFIWDCWPCYYDKMEKWLRKHKVRTAIFTSFIEMEEMRRRIPEIHFVHCPEAVDTSLYKAGKDLKDRSIDLLEFGRSNRLVFSGERLEGINHVCTNVGDKFVYTNDQLYAAMGDAKMTICLPKSMTHPQIAEGVETLTQRYWEAMLSRMVIVGHCPKELEDLLGYNPVVEAPLNFPINGIADENDNENLILDILEHIDDYQELVDKNRVVALNMGDWSLRIDIIRKQLISLNYSS